MKRLTALLLTVVLVFALVGCGKKKREIVQLTLSTEDSEAILAAAGITLPDAETVPAAGSTIKWYAWYDGFHNYSDDEIVNTGFWTFKEKYGCEIEWVECEWSQRFDGLANLMLSDSSPDFAPSDLGAFPMRTIKGMYQAVDDYIDYDDPLWSGTKDYVYNYLSLNDKAYLICTDIYNGNVCAYNRRVISEWGFDDPAELFYNDEWTWDRFYEMCVDFSDPNEDRYALDSFGFSSTIMRSSGVSIVSYDTEKREFVANIDNPALERAADLLYNLGKNDCVYPWWSNGWKLRDGIEGSGIGSGLQLFFIGGGYTFTGPVDTVTPIFGDIAAGEVMFCPLPRDPNGDGNYYTECNPGGYFLVNNAPNPEGVALFAACERFKVLDPTVISIDDKNKREIYLWNDEMMNMSETLHDMALSEYVTVDGFGLTKGAEDNISKFQDNGHGQEVSTWAQIKESASEPLLYYLDELNGMIRDFENGIIPE